MKRNIDKISYGIIIKNLRKSNKFSQTKLGKMVGASKSAISSYELETAVPSIQTFIEICIACDANLKITFNSRTYEMEEISRENY